MVDLETATLGLHVAAGTIALLAGLGAMVTRKGGRRHRRAGRVYVASMAVVVGTVLPLFALDPSQLRAFLVLAGTFSGYLAFSGYRALSRGRPADGAERVDWLAVVLVAAACLALGGWGLARLLGGDFFGTVLLVFGGVGLSMGIADARSFRTSGEDGRENGESGREWLVNHLTRMVAAYIATVTAVSVVNLTLVNRVVSWLWPTVVGTLLILYWQAKYADTGPLAGYVGD
ncbi:hypothetical protein BRD13_01815 [Halobacteriales archaeon SW_5_70_135]|nr:MAG: hypothetical protein BRD13_01815 [Halobacteriales archaeon SW_5_70_135]